MVAFESKQSGMVWIAFCAVNLYITYFSVQNIINPKYRDVSTLIALYCTKVQLYILYSHYPNNTLGEIVVITHFN